jgi:NhaA family Na+:H+ antiporter
MSSIQRISQAFLYFFRQESAGGILLLLCAVIAMLIANSPAANLYAQLLHTEIPIPGLTMSVLHWINDGLMVLFFFVVGLEIKREFLFGELKSLSATILPIAAAAGGMVVPALFYFAFNAGLPTLSGWAIPMSTDIAFSLGVLAFAAKGVPKSIAVFLTALAIVDDLGGIIVLALFYSDSPSLTALGAAVVIVLLLWAASRRDVRSPFLYLAGGIALWFAFHHAGVHPTVAGVLVGFLTPAGTAETQDSAPLTRWEHALTPWNAFLIMPVFALANAGIPLSAESFLQLTSPIGLGIIAGLFIGKPLGICLMVYLLIRTGLARIPEGVRPSHFLGAGVLAGIGFTMSLFLAALSFPTPEDLITAKAAIVTASLLSGVLGTLIFRLR